MSGFEVGIVGGGQSVPLVETPLSLGRGPTNELVLSDGSVSWHHAQLWVEGGRPWVRDLGSRNGTFVNGTRLVGSGPLSAGDTLRLGTTMELVVQGQGASRPVAEVRHLEDLSTGMRLLLVSDRFTIGAAPGSDLRIEGLPDRAATLLLHENGEIWLGTEAGEVQLVLGEVFELHGRELRVVTEALDHAPTVDFGAHVYPYKVRADARGVEPQVTLVDLACGRELLLTGNKAALVFVLARQLQRHRAEGRSRAEEGWCTTREMLTGVWGRGQTRSNHLNVLVHRVRQQLEREGFEAWCIEKRRGGIRLRAQHVEMVTS